MPINMSEREVINDLLFSEKKITSNYDVYSNEASNMNLRNELMGLLNCEHDIHNKIYDAMVQKGWYTTTTANPMDIQKAKQNFQNVKSSL
ncbi:MAG: spore coat protein [Clostridiales bacterium]|nr:spore coat protein [Clostridiales bacterium]HBM81930.1 spore coat protein [Clostridiaceae bacterium]